ncbi:unnamed protein product [Paramecium primaurelia]|uniref:Uncharacterized protein n=1 Tax=Paramecium primaurelia TaxID=5886 RepID=A0A8S1LTX5_PARPR|nr:unnamed protein product [Paramecium primaurelia]
MKKDGGLQLISQIIEPVGFLTNNSCKTLTLRVMDILFFYQKEPFVQQVLRLFRQKFINQFIKIRIVFSKKKNRIYLELRMATKKRKNKNLLIQKFDQKSAQIQQGIKKYVLNKGFQKDFIFVKFKNGAKQIMSQLAPMQLFQKRQIDSIWDIIVMIYEYPFDFHEKLIFIAKENQPKFISFNNLNYNNKFQEKFKKRQIIKRWLSSSQSLEIKIFKIIFDEVIGYFREEYYKVTNKYESDIQNQSDIDETDEISNKSILKQIQNFQNVSYSEI